MWIRNTEKQWAGSVKGNIGLLQVNVSVYLINTKLCSLIHIHTHPLLYTFFSSVLFWEGGYFAQRTIYNGFPNPFTPINYSDVTKPHYACKCSQLTESSGSCVSVYMCVYIPLYSLILCNQKMNMWSGECMSITKCMLVFTCCTHMYSLRHSCLCKVVCTACVCV